LWPDDDYTTEKYDYTPDYEELPLSKRTVALIEEVQDHYDMANGGYTNVAVWREDLAKSEGELFYKKAVRLFKMIEDEMGEWFNITNCL